MATPNPKVRRTQFPPGLDAFLQPKSVAVVGASEVVGKVGQTVMHNLLANPYPREIYPVNPSRGTIAGRTAYQSLSSLPCTPDLAVIVTPAPTVPGIIEECSALGVPAALIISAGFRETGAKGTQLEHAILAVARRSQMRIIGPNCLGVMCPSSQLNATFAAGMALPGSVAFLSQSGALCTAVLDWSLEEQVGFSAIVSLGSMLDVGWGDVISHFGDDPATNCIVIYMETVGDPRAFLSAAREVALRKPIVLIKAGRSEVAARATMSHTGSLAGSDAVFDAALRRCGILRVKTIADVFYMAEVLGKQPHPKGPRLTIVTNAGGPGVLATDALIDYEGTLADLGAQTLDDLNQLLPEHWSHGNPIDVLGDATPERYVRAIQIALRDPETDGLLVIVTPQGMTASAEIARALVDLGNGGKPVLASFMGGVSVKDAIAILNANSIPSFPYPDSAARIFEYMWQYSRNLQTLYETPVVDEEGSGPVPDSVGSILHEASTKGRAVLTEAESKLILQAYGIPIVETVVAQDEDLAVAAAARLGLPVVLKLNSETITHKTDVDGVILNIASEEAVREAFRSIRDSVKAKAGPGHFGGVAVQRMMGGGYEVILGSSVDAQFGPVLLFGLGGELVEVFRDSALGLPPLNTTLARRLMEQTKIYLALKGVRGRRSADLNLLERILVRFSRLVVEQPRIREIDINPLLVSEYDIRALDARIILHPATVTDEQLPRSAIRPYPVEYAGEWVTSSGDRVYIRPIRPEDELEMVAFHATLSDRSVHMRYFAGLSLQHRTGHTRLTRVCGFDYDLEIALVVECGGDKQERQIVAVGRLVRVPESDSAEFAIVVSDDFQRRGLGTELLRRLVNVGRAEGIAIIQGWILSSNTTMQNVCRELGFQLHAAAEDADLIQATLNVRGGASPD